jgi:hypothetical protein
MNKRKLQTGEEVQELLSPVTLKVYTKCPEKWMLIDLETGEKYLGYSTKGKNDWRRVGACQTLT